MPKKKSDLEPIIQSLVQYLDGRDWFQAEDAAEKLSIDVKYIRQAIHKLRVLPGWSIKEENRKAYWRATHRSPVITDRKKGEKYDHDPNEPEWDRTAYVILKRPADIIP